MEIGSVSSSNEAYLQKLLTKQAQSESSDATDSASSESTDAANSAVQTANYDILELSENFVSSTNMALLGSDAGNYDSVSISDEAQQYLNAQDAADSTDQTEDSESVDSTETLSLCTKEQLKKLLESDEITQAEYNAEIARRETEEAQEESLSQDEQQTAEALD